MNVYLLLTLWFPFGASFLISLILIWFFADVLKVRLYVPINKARERRRRLVSSEGTESAQELIGLHRQYSQMNYRQLHDTLLDPTKSDSLSPEAFNLLKLAYIYQARNRLHVHHFFFGIILMPVTWGLFLYVGVDSGMILAGFVYALFISELKQLLTQKWGP
jgi:hypothetical protein